MEAIHYVHLDDVAKVYGGRDEALVARILGANDEATRARLAGSVDCGNDPAAVLRAIIEGDTRAIDDGALMQMFDIVVHHVGTAGTFIDEEFDESVITALHRAKVRVDRGATAPLPWPIARSRTGTPSVYVWSLADLATLADEIDAFIQSAPTEVAEGARKVAHFVRGLIDDSKEVVTVNWY
jgi:hypothetical protein